MAYATTADLAHGLPARALAPLSLADQGWYLDNAAAEMDTYLRARYTLPLVSTPYELRACNVALAVCDILVFLGLNPGEYDALYASRCERWRQWLRDLAAGKVSLDDAIDATPGASAGGPVLDSLPSRGWGEMMTGEESRQ